MLYALCLNIQVKSNKQEIKCSKIFFSILSITFKINFEKNHFPGLFRHVQTLL